MPRGKTPRHFCFTLNNYHTDGRMGQAEWLSARCTYIVWGKEVGDSGTPHLQGYAECKSQIHWDTFTKHCHDMNIEKRMGTAQQAADYCKKGEQPHAEWQQMNTKGPNYGLNADVFEEGECSQQGRRNDIETCTEMINEGRTMKEVAGDNPSAFVKFHRGLQAYKTMMTAPRSGKPEVIVRFGPTGSGKSLLAHHETNDAFVWKPQMGAWWDGYDGETHVIMEEFRGQLAFEVMLDLLDRYECKVQVKGGMAAFVATKIVLCSPVPPWEWYPRNAANTRDNLSQLQRRITKIFEHRESEALKAETAESDLASEVLASEVVWGNNNTHTSTYEANNFPIFGNVGESRHFGGHNHGWVGGPQFP